MTAKTGTDRSDARRVESDDWRLMASEGDQSLILKSLNIAAGLDSVFEDD